MIHIKPGSQALEVLTLLAVAGEFSMSSVCMLGNMRAYKKIIGYLTEEQDIKLGDTVRHCRLLRVSGHGAMKTIRLTMYAREVLKAIGAYEYYQNAFANSNLSSGAYHKERRFRVGESLAMCMKAGVEMRPYKLPKLTRMHEQYIKFTAPVFYLAKELKKINSDELNKTKFTRVTGLLLAGGQAYSVYNTGDRLMKWQGTGEDKTRNDMNDIVRLNFKCNDIDAAILFYKTENVALKTIREIARTNSLKLGFSRIYHRVHLVPLNAEGIEQLKLMLIDNWWEEIQDAMFEESERSYDRGLFTYDAYVKDNYVLNFLDGDVGKLIKFQDSIQSNRIRNYKVACYPHQLGFLKSYFGDKTEFIQIKMETIQKALGLKEDEE